MSLLETYDKNKEKHLLNEVTATGATGTFVGRSGNFIDDLFAGPFHPDFGDIKKELDNQIEVSIAKRMWVDDTTPFIEQDFIDLEWDYGYDEYVEKDNSKFKTTGDKMQMVDLEIQYDKIKDKTKENEKFINNSNGWKSIYDSKKY